MSQSPQWLAWATELQALAQIGLTYSKDPFDLERFARIRAISLEMLAQGCDLPVDKLEDLFCGESGYQTPKLDCRAAIVRGEELLLVQENSGRWALPGGWMDIGLTVGENTAKEALEEAGLSVTPRRIVAIQDWQKNNCSGPKAQSICKVFVLCGLEGGQFRPNSETLASGWFTLDHLPPLEVEKSTPAQLELCIKAAQSPTWETVFD